MQEVPATGFTKSVQPAGRQKNRKVVSIVSAEIIEGRLGSYADLAAVRTLNGSGGRIFRVQTDAKEAIHLHEGHRGAHYLNQPSVPADGDLSITASVRGEADVSTPNPRTLRRPSSKMRS